MCRCNYRYAAAGVTTPAGQGTASTSACLYNNCCDKRPEACPALSTTLCPWERENDLRLHIAVQYALGLSRSDRCGNVSQEDWPRSGWLHLAWFFFYVAHHACRQSQ